MARLLEAMVVAGSFATMITTLILLRFRSQQPAAAQKVALCPTCLRPYTYR